jgi:hypothetical protein
MIRTSKAPVAWPVPWAEGRRYFFRAGDITERDEYEAVLDGEMRAGQVFPWEFAAAFDEGVLALFADSPDDAAQLIELQANEKALDAGESLPAGEQALLDQARDVLAQHWPAYKALVSQEARRRHHAPTLAFRMFCTGFEGDGLPAFTKAADGLVSLAAMAELPALEIKAGGQFAFRLLYGRGEEVEKNSAAPSPSGEGQQSSPSPAPRADGTSEATSGSETPLEQSPDGPSPPSTSGSTADG